jgi:hypothetical protein
MDWWMRMVDFLTGWRRSQYPAQTAEQTRDLDQKLERADRSIEAVDRAREALDDANRRARIRLTELEADIWRRR